MAYLPLVSELNICACRLSADDDCSHEIKRHLLLGRKVMTHLDSIWKTRDITLPAKICLVKASSHAWMWELDYKENPEGRSQDGGGIGRGDHFLSYKFIERTTERWTKFTKQLLIVSSGHQAPRKAAHCLRREGKKFVFLFSFLLFFCLFFSPISF